MMVEDLSAAFYLKAKMDAANKWSKSTVKAVDDHADQLEAAARESVVTPHASLNEFRSEVQAG